ncbi:tetraacyldisaccharide 4'-kinase [Alloacidobacterium dinghuense]|uniref:Tetraacyldisaccharide 4'-kinase n=1 Tax=Alloacidobacterium dinghuense TaxID=2763107 RepID=A0A7G8BL11_9BACT|nr:tetraacyldisaccharide 4'-kinase [Alloacidobacterium dinghuense]QNI33231.1 tetraacyldisaccharide 4'-kinase [Alloacidobacterium dinghuense]
MTRRLLFPLNPIYAAAVGAKNAAFDKGLVRARRLLWSVISVGNISVGGSGKTPFVIALARLLKQHGVYVDVLSRGYGRNSDAVEQVDPTGDVERFGDEPVLIAQSANVPVYVGARRYAAGLLAENILGNKGIHLLDDGFQHRRLARAVDIVVMHRSDLQEKLLPSGNLRESLGSLHRASVLVLREEDVDLEQELKRRGIEKPVWFVKRSIILPENLGKAVAFCGIGRPDEFFHSLQKLEGKIVARSTFGDHHRYSEGDVQQLIRMAQAQRAEAFLTTEKDLVRLSPTQRTMMASVVPLKVAKLVTAVHDEASVLQSLEGLLPPNFAHSL